MIRIKVRLYQNNEIQSKQSQHNPRIAAQICVHVGASFCVAVVNACMYSMYLWWWVSMVCMVRMEIPRIYTEPKNTWLFHLCISSWKKICFSHVCCVLYQDNNPTTWYCFKSHSFGTKELFGQSLIKTGKVALYHHSRVQNNKKILDQSYKLFNKSLIETLCNVLLMDWIGELHQFCINATRTPQACMLK